MWYLLGVVVKVEIMLRMSSISGVIIILGTGYCCYWCSGLTLWGLPQHLRLNKELWNKCLDQSTLVLVLGSLWVSHSEPVSSSADGGH